MFLSAEEIAQSREHALNNFLGLSSAYLEAGQRLSELLSSTSREVLDNSSKHLSQYDHRQLNSASQLPGAIWLDSSPHVSRALEETLDILGDTHKAAIRSAEAQVLVFDELALASIRRATKTSPWEAELALNTMKTTLQNAEKTLHGMTEAALETLDSASDEAPAATDVAPAPIEPTAPLKPATQKRAAAPK